jgi:hypothetical protein
MQRQGRSYNLAPRADSGRERARTTGERLLSSEDRPKVRIGRDDDPSLFARAFNDVRVWGRVHPVSANVTCIMPGPLQKFRQMRRKRVVDEESHAGCGSGNSRSIAEAAANLKHSRRSSFSRSGYSERISDSDRPPASKRRTVATGIRRWRTQGTPPICAGSILIRSKFLILLLSQPRKLIAKSRTPVLLLDAHHWSG